MIKPLRKKHFQIWILLAFLIPAGIISAYMSVPKDVFNKLLQENKSGALPVLIKKVEKKGYTVYLRSSDDKNNYQLQWTNKNIAAHPSSLLYKASPSPQAGAEGGTLKAEGLIGRIAGEGTYFFSLPKDTAGRYHFILYDIIQQQIIDSIKF
jgi:hypothetical protein